MTAVSAISTMHEQMNKRAEQEKDIRHGAKNVHPVLFPEKEDCDGQEQADTEPEWDIQPPVGWCFTWTFNVMVHVRLPGSIGGVAFDEGGVELWLPCS
jgi:hypothetical protein